MTTIRSALATGVATALLLGAHAGAAHAADFGVSAFSASVSTAQAGAHPTVTVEWTMATEGVDANGFALPVGSLKDVRVDLPPGLVGDPRAAAQCTAAQLKAQACPRESMVGDMLFTAAGVVPFPTAVYNMVPPAGQVADFAADPIGGGQFTIHARAQVRSNGDYGLAIDSTKISSLAPVTGVKYEFWGVPADHAGLPPGWDPSSADPPFGAPLPGAARKPFLTNPSRCGVADAAAISVRAHGEQAAWLAPVRASLPAITGCDAQPFAPSVDVTPSTRAAGQPSGYQVDLAVPQNSDPDGPATANLDDVTVTMPEGVSLSPAVADGLGACSDEELAVESTEPERCPGSAKIGTVTIATPVLQEPLTGAIYIGTQRSSDPMSGEMYRIFLTAYGQGVRLKLRGMVKADPATGRLSATFLDNPQLPFEHLTLAFKGGPRAPLVNPPACGTGTTTSALSSWGGQARETSSAMTIDQGCPSGRFAPGFTAGTLNPLAGGFSPFVMTATRADADQDLSSLRLALPSGLLGALDTVPVCAEAQAASGACGPASRLGSPSLAVGAGAAPFALSGTVSLAGPYKGRPYSLSIAVPAKAGPFDLGMVVVRAPLDIDAAGAKVSAPVDDLPQIVGGVPLHYRSISVALDRPGFMFNATSCAPQAVAATLTSVGGAVASPVVPYQAQGCEGLVLAPRLALRYSGKAELKEDRHPAIDADLSDTFGHANLRTVTVTLPLTSSLDADNANGLCEVAGAAARTCPPESIVGYASATTPALHEPLSGPVYFVKGLRTSPTGRVVKTLPKLYLKLAGSGVEIDLHADSSVVDQHLVTTFRDIPDVPLQDFKLRLNGGRHGIIVAVEDPCAADNTASVVFEGHNGAVTRRTLKVGTPECAPAISAATATASRLTVRVSGIGPGRLAIGGARVRSAARTIVAATTARITARTRLTKAQRRLLSRGRSVKVAIRVTFRPKAGKAVALRRTLTIAGSRR